jgi:hypothetical protein
MHRAELGQRLLGRKTRVTSGLADPCPRLERERVELQPTTSSLVT